MNSNQQSVASDQIDKGQIKKIKTLQSKMKMPDEDYRLRLSEYWAKSCKELSYSEAENFIKELTALAKEKGVWSTGKEKYDNLGHRQGMAAPSKLRMIEAMWKNISYVHDAHKREAALRKFIFKIAHVDSLEFLTTDGADKVINALRHIKARHTREPQVCRDRSNNF